MKFMKHGWIALLLLSSWLAGCDGVSDIQPSGKVYKVAYIGKAESPGQSEIEDVLEGILAANAAEPLLDNGDRLEIVNISQSGNVKGISGPVKEQIERGDMSAILLGGNSKSVLQIRNDIDALQIPTLAVIATHPDVIEQVGYISQLSFDDERQAQAAALFVRDELALKRAAVLFGDTDPHSGYLGQVFRTTFEQAGGELDEFSVVSGLSQSMLQRLKDRDTQIIYIPLEPLQVFQVLELLAEIDWEPVVMGADGLLAGVKQAYPQRMTELNGMYVTDLYADIGEFVSVAKYVKKIAGLHDQMFSDEASTDTALGVEGYQVIKFAMNHCPDRNNGACINREIRSIKNLRGIVSKFSILANGKASRPIYVNTIQDGHLKLVVRVN